MKNFKTVLNDNHVYLMWTSVNEQEDCIYVLERSNDEVNYDYQTVMNGVAGNFELFYSWIDEFPNQGNNYYRIEKVTASGEHYYSKINTVFHANPVSGQTATTVK